MPPAGLHHELLILLLLALGQAVFPWVVWNLTVRRASALFKIKWWHIFLLFSISYSFSVDNSENLRHHPFCGVSPFYLK